MATETALRWSVGPASDAVAPSGIELIASIDIRQNRYRGWHPVAGAWDPSSTPFNVHQTGQVRPNGTAFGMQPACGAFPGQGPVTGFEGRRLINSKNRNLGTLIGELQSDVFTIAGDGIDFLIGGGDFTDVTCLNLYVHGATGWQRVRSTTGERNLELVRRGWDVADFRGLQAYLQILDYAPVEPWGWHAAPRYPEDDWGFILVDDIRQTDGAPQPRRVDEAGDRARNFDFETALPERFTVAAAQGAGGAGGVFAVHDRERDGAAGSLHCDVAVDRCAPDLWKVSVTWRYRGMTLSGVKLRLTSRLPIAADAARHTLHPADFVAPYGVTTRFPGYLHAPPNLIRFGGGEDGASGAFVHGLRVERHPYTMRKIYQLDRERRYPVRFFGAGEEYRFLGLFKARAHLFVPAEEGAPLFLFGTDRLGRDLFSRVLHAARISLSIGLIGVLLSTVLGVLLGGLAGYFGGIVDRVVMRLVDLLSSIPTIPLWMGLAAAVPRQWTVVTTYFAITLILSLVGWTHLARVVRGRFLSLREEEFVMAAVVSAVRERTIIFGHLLPSFLS